jgi:cyclomaltodextrinase / maltogenic alpha-amylase / neopullulanase
MKRTTQAIWPRSLALLLAAGCTEATPLVATDDGAGEGGAANVDGGGGAGGSVLSGDGGGSVAATPFEVWRQREPIYELYVRHFSEAGTFKGVEERLPELKALGIGIVWLLPVHEIGSIVSVNGSVAIDAPHGNPYAVKSYERLNPEYGSLGTEESAEADLESLVESAHGLDMRVILDWVPNHTAWDNPLTLEHPDWYVWENGAIKPVGPEFQWIAQLDWSNEPLRDYMADQMVDFVERFDLDGFRIDFAHSMPLEFFDELRGRLEEVKPVFLLAESGDIGFHPTFDMTYDWNVYPVFGDVAWESQPVTAIDDALYFSQLIPYADKPDALVMRMTYNHDDNGKFTLGERYRDGIKTFAVLACTLPGKPLLFDGQEVGMNVFDGMSVQHSTPLGHDPAVKIDWSDPDGYRPFYTKLLQLFRANPALHQPGMGDFRRIDTQPSAGAYSFVRRNGEDAVVVVLNLSDETLPSVTLAPSENAGPIEGEYVELFSEASVSLAVGQEMILEPWAYRVYVRGPIASE